MSSETIQENPSNSSSPTGADEKAPESKLDSAQKMTDEVKDDASDSPRSAIPLLELSTLFILALVVRLIYNYFLPHSNNFASCDAFEYIQNAQLILNLPNMPASFWTDAQSCLLANASPAQWESVKQALLPMKDFYISGPVFPAFLALTVLICGGAASPITNQWQILLSGNIFVSALTCVFIALSAREVFDRNTARIAGAISILYPAFIVNSGRLYSETLATCLLSAISYLTLRGFRQGGNSALLVFLTGFLAAALQLSRSIMVALSLALLPITILQQGFARSRSAITKSPGAGSADSSKPAESDLTDSISGEGRSVEAADSFTGKRSLLRRVARGSLFLLPFALGFMLVAAPWLGFQKLAFGGGGLVVDRVGRYNFFIGNNVETQGWLSYPYPDGRGVESRSFGDLASTAIKANPGKWMRLMLDKPLRLFKFPWNDFRTEIGPISFSLQVLFHELMVLFALFGIVCAAVTGFAWPPERRQLLGRTFLLGLLAFHCVYFLFITVPRYNLTAIPELIVFAAAGLSLLVSLFKPPSVESQSRMRFWAVGAFASLILLFVVLQTNLMAFAIPFAEMIHAGNEAQLAWVLQAAGRLSALALVAFSLFKVIAFLNGNKLIARAMLVFLLIPSILLLTLPNRADGRWTEWQKHLRPGESAKQTIFMPIAELKNGSNGIGSRGLFLLVDTDVVKQKSDGFCVLVNGTKLDGPVLPSMCFAEGFERFLEISPAHFEREGEHMWDSLGYSANRGNVDQRQWAMLPLSAELVEKTIADAQGRRSTNCQFDIEVKNENAVPSKEQRPNLGQQIALFGNYQTGQNECTFPSVSNYSWEKAFYGVENPEGMTDTRYDIKVLRSNRATQSQDLSSDPGVQNGALNMLLLLGPPTPLAKPGAIAVVSTSAASVLRSLNLKMDKLQSEESWKASCNIAGLGCNDSDLLVAHLRGRTRVRDGRAVPRVSGSAGYKKEDGTVFVYDSPWTPLRIDASKDWREFEIVFPVKPILNGRHVEELSISLGQTVDGPSYSNVPLNVDGKAEFSELKLDILRLGTNPIGLGHKVF